jgi:hypothetical protein
VSFLFRSLSHSRTLMLALTAAAAGSTACSAGSPNPDEIGGETSSASAVSAAPSTGASPTAAPAAAACSTPSENCPCTDDGLTVQCTGPKIQVGNYTSCLPGVRVCMSGTWSACVGRTVYQDVDTVTQDYTSPCGAGQTVRWGALTIQGDTPGDSQIDVAVQSANSEAALDAGQPTLIGALDGTSTAPWSGIDVGSALANDQLGSGSLLRVTLRLVRTAPSNPSPVVMSFQQATTCVPQ